MRTAALLLVVLSAQAFGQPRDIAERRSVEGNPRQEFFLIDYAGGKRPAEGFRLLLVLPGGDGSAGYKPFVTNIAKHAAGPEYLVAQLIAVKWTPDQHIVWPTERSRVKRMKFSTGDYMRAVIADIKKDRKIDAEHIYTLTWSSSGPAAYAASLAGDEIKGSFIAMSVFKPRDLPSLGRARGHRYYIYHSPEDNSCPIRMAEDAATKLSKHGAEVEFVTYEGGHGWHGNVMGDLRKGFRWLERR